MANPFKKPKAQKIEIPKPDPQRIPGDNMLAMQEEERQKERERQRMGGRYATILMRNSGTAPRILGG